MLTLAFLRITRLNILVIFGTLFSAYIAAFRAGFGRISNSLPFKEDSRKELNEILWSHPLFRCFKAYPYSSIFTCENNPEHQLDNPMDMTYINSKPKQFRVNSISSEKDFCVCRNKSVEMADFNAL